MRFCSGEDRNIRHVKKAVEEPFKENETKWLLWQLVRLSLTRFLRLLLLPRGDTAFLFWPWMPPSAPTPPVWCAEGAGAVADQLLHGHFFQCQETTVARAYFKCMSSVGLLLKIAAGSESQPNHWVMSQGHHQVSPLPFRPCKVQAPLQCGHAASQWLVTCRLGGLQRLSGHKNSVSGRKRFPPLLQAPWLVLLSEVGGLLWDLALPWGRICGNPVKVLLCLQCTKEPLTGHNVAKNWVQQGSSTDLICSTVLSQGNEQKLTNNYQQW